MSMRLTNKLPSGASIDTRGPMPDTLKWDTAVQPKGGLDWIVVEMYSNPDEAHQGHEKWIEEMTNHPTHQPTDALAAATLKAATSQDPNQAFQALFPGLTAPVEEKTS